MQKCFQTLKQKKKPENKLQKINIQFSVPVSNLFLSKINIISTCLFLLPYIIKDLLGNCHSIWIQSRFTISVFKFSVSNTLLNKRRFENIIRRIVQKLWSLESIQIWHNILSNSGETFVSLFYNRLMKMGKMVYFYG